MLNVRRSQAATLLRGITCTFSWSCPVTMEAHTLIHPSQMTPSPWPFGADISLATSFCDLPQNEQCNDFIFKLPLPMFRLTFPANRNHKIGTAGMLSCQTHKPFMRIKRTLPVLIGVLAIAAAVVAVVQLRKRAPPEAVRLLPGADGFFYINLKWIRTFNATNQLPPVLRDPDYQKFVEETGFQFERDLDQAGFAVHYPQSWGNGATGATATEPRFSEIFVGKIDAGRLTAYLKKLSSSVDNYKGFDIYNVPIESRTVRVAVLSTDSVAVSNHPD